MTSIIFCVTNDLYFDRRMHKICSSLQAAGYEVTLVGRSNKEVMKDTAPSYRRHWLTCWLKSGPFFYVEFQLRLWIFLLLQKKSILCAIDLDTMPAVFMASILKKQVRVVDAHELFTEQKEVVSRKWVHRIWLTAERWLVPRFPLGYTVNDQLSQEFKKRYGVNYVIVRNVPLTVSFPVQSMAAQQPWIIYQGAVNEGRSFETLIPAMTMVDAPLHIYGKGNFLEEVQQLIHTYKLKDKVICHAPVLPEKLVQLTPQATIGVTLFEKTGLNQYWSLANRFFDYIMAGIPQICSDFPAYQSILAKYPVGLAVNPEDPEAIAAALNKLLTDRVVYEQCKRACWEARQELNWEREQQLLLDFYAKLS